jgi:hypothetical protein
LLEPWLCIGLDGLRRAFRFANAAVDAFVGMNDQHVLALIETIDGANFDAVHVLAFDAIFDDDVGHEIVPRAFAGVSRAQAKPSGAAPIRFRLSSGRKERAKGTPRLLCRRATSKIP